MSGGRGMTGEAEEIILASASPRRKELLERCGLSFRVLTAGVDEEPLPAEAPEAMVRRLAASKAAAISSSFPHAWVIGADTTVVLNGEVLGKPRDAEDAARMLGAMQAGEHEVWGGIAVQHGARGLAREAACVTRVRFAPLAMHEIALYIASGEPMDKAGAYAIQGRGMQFVQSISGSYSNVVGLDVVVLLQMLRSMGAAV